jgi:hypothetical protein
VEIEDAASRVSELSFLLRGGRGGRGLRHLPENSLLKPGDRYGDESDGAEFGSKFSLGIFGGLVFCELGVGVFELKSALMTI